MIQAIHCCYPSERITRVGFFLTGVGGAALACYSVFAAVMHHYEPRALPDAPYYGFFFVCAGTFFAGASLLGIAILREWSILLFSATLAQRNVTQIV